MTGKLKSYPVGNGDTALLVHNKTTFIVDCNLRKSSENEDDDSQFDVKKDLLTELQKRKKNPYVDVFILTHPDQDHCRNFGSHFYQGNPKDYSDKNRDNEEIIIDELWVTSMLFTYDQSEHANAIRNEANRRIKLQDENHADKNKRGNRIILIGYDNSSKFENVTSYVPSTIVEKFNNKKEDTFSIFIHAPFKADLIKGKADKDRNTTSIVFQARYKAKADDTSFVAQLMLNGDADHYIWEKILEKTKENDNEQALNYDVFFAPHHCSWTYFNDVSYDKKENQTPKDYSLEVLDYKNDGAYIIASSKKIENKKPNPPHYPAKTEYVKKLDSKDNFLNTAIHPSEDAPKPIIFNIDKDGISLEEEKKENDNKQSKSFTKAQIASLTHIGRQARQPYYDNKL